MAAALDRIDAKADSLRELDAAEREALLEPESPARLWLSGEYTDYNREHN